MKKANRTMKVCGQSGYQYKPTPTITLKGAWLEDCGFKIDTPIIVQCEKDRLIIVKRNQKKGTVKIMIVPPHERII